MENLLIIVMIALIAESVWETLKMTWQEGKISIDRIGALVVALIFCIGVRLDILALLGINVTIPFLGVILTGILISRGSNFIHDLLAKIGQVSNKQE
jgi:chromate transport protein ChrA